MYAPICFFIGLPGSGKSFWGKKVAAHFGWQWRDLDKEIEAKYQASVASIFEREGETVFRSMEKEMLHFLVENACMVGATLITTGGGTPCFNENMQYMKTHGRVVWLDVEKATLVERLFRSTTRPLTAGLTMGQLGDYVEAIALKRSPFYQQADVRILSPISLESFIPIFSPFST